MVISRNEVQRLLAAQLNEGKTHADAVRSVAHCFHQSEREVQAELKVVLANQTEVFHDA